MCGKQRWIKLILAPALSDVFSEIGAHAPITNEIAGGRFGWIAIAAKKKSRALGTIFSKPVRCAIILRHLRAKRKIFNQRREIDQTADGGLRAFIIFRRDRRRSIRQRMINHLFRFLLLFLFNPSPLLNIARMLFERLGKNMAPCSICDKIEILSCGGISCRLKRGASRISDWSRRQAINCVGVVGRPFFNFRTQNPAS